MLRRRWRSDATVSLDEIAEQLDAIARPFSDASVVLYGSTVRVGRVVGDIDVWIDGDHLTTASLRARIERFWNERGLPVDLVTATDPVMNVRLAEAVQWCVNREGLAVAGRLPPPPVGVTFGLAERAYRHSILQRAAEIATQAEIYALADLPSAATLTEASVRAWVRSAAADRATERQLRDVPGELLLPELARLEPMVAEHFAEYGWASTAATIDLAATLKARALT